jgi:Tol biopolymer transport system component
VPAQVTQRVSVSSSGAQGNGDSGGGNWRPAVSSDGRYVAFDSQATNLVPGDVNGYQDIFVRDRQTGVTELVSIATSGSQGNADCWLPFMSTDGRFVAFNTLADTLVPGDTNGQYDVFLHDRQNGTTERVSIGSGGVEGDGPSAYASISADGRYVAFHSLAANLVTGDTNFNWDVFVRDRQAGTTERISIDSGGLQGNFASLFPSISADGRYVAFQSAADNLVPGDTNGVNDIFVRDRLTGTTERVSLDSNGTEGNLDSRLPSISADGRFVAYNSEATNLVPGDTTGGDDIFVRDRQAGTTERVSVTSGGGQAGLGSIAATISADGRFVAFQSIADNLVPGDTNLAPDVFVHDRQSGTTERVSVDSGGSQGNLASVLASISATGRYVVFVSDARDLVPGDTNLRVDIFLRDRTGGTSFTSLCDPGVGGVLACPCANPPSGPGRGCDNSAASGGAIISVYGGAYLSSDSLVFSTTGEKPTATSLLLQGTSLVASGAIYGQGVRCVGGTLTRLFTKSAVAGSITAPDFGAGDPTISARSAAKGDVIQPGQSRWYLVYYRDPSVLGGCPASSTFNATQTGQVSWWP